MLKNLLKPLTPQFLKNWRWARMANRHRELASRLAKACDLQVISGPFANMKYISVATGSMLGPKLLGTYEKEIFDWVEEIIALPYQTIYDVGAAEGYYAIGFLFRMPNCLVHAYDTNRHSHAMQTKLAAANNVSSRLTIGQAFDPAILDIDADESSRTLLFVDIDGSESTLLDPGKYPALQCVDLLVETHDCFVPGVTQQIHDRFSKTHEILVKDSVNRRLDELPNLEGFSSADRLELANEHRPQQQWLWLKKRQKSEPFL